MAVIKKSKKPTKKKVKKAESISSLSRMEQLLSEAEKELADLQPKIDELEKHAAKLQELKQTKQKLITLKLSLKSILSNFGTGDKMQAFDLLKLDVKSSSKAKQTLEATFFPDQAFEAANKILKHPASINYELFRAIVFHGGQANTQEIRRYLIDNDIKAPGSGDSFEEIPLTDISSRVNYLVRKGLVEPQGRGVFKSLLGWDS